MASGDQLDYVPPSRLIHEGGSIGVEAPQLGGAYGTVFVHGKPLRRSDGTAYEFLSRLPGTASLVTGATFTVYLVDDPANPNVSGTVKLGIQVKRLISGTSTLTLTSASTEKTFTQAMPATTGIVVAKACAIAVADLPTSTAAGDSILVRIRRVIDSNDTHQGNVLVCGVAITDT